MIVGRETNNNKPKPPKPPKPSSDVPTAEEMGGASGSTGGTGKVKIGVDYEFLGVGRTPKEISKFVTVDEAKNLIQKSLATSDSKTYNQIIRAIGPGYTKRQYESIWREAVDWAVWNNTTPFQAIKSANFDVGVLQDYKPSGGAAQYTPTASVRQYTPSQAKNTATEVFRAFLQRNPTKQELDEFTADLNAAAARNPVTTVTKLVDGKAVTTTSGEFDVASWARGYVSARFKGETDSLATRSREDLLNTAKSYGVNMGDAWYTRAGNQIMKGQDPEKYLDDIRKTAASRYAAFADRILAGDTVEQIASPYINAYAGVLELNPFDIDVMDTTIQQALLNTDDSGQNKPINLFQFEQNLKKDPRWQQTKNAQQTYSGLATKILQDFGLMG
jgi:hypothetical protein